MKRLTVLVLCFAMIFSLLSTVSVSAAPAGKAINSASDFYNMSPSGTYYLNSDIKINQSYSTPFVGTFDGNGHTVTVSAPLFYDFSGEVKNLTIKGDLYYSDANAAAFAVISSKGFNATNCVNNANVTVVGNAKLAAGFVTESYYNDNPMRFTDCVNNGNIYIDSTADEKPRAGGFGAIIDGVVLNNCANHGDIYVKGNIGIAGGLVARAAWSAGLYTAEAFNCLNTGNVMVEDTYIGKDGVSLGNGGADAGGIFGHVGTKGNFAWYRIWGCRNDGKIEAPYRAGGLVAYVYASRSDQFVDIQFCINTGDIVYGRTKKVNDSTDIWDYAGPFIGYTNSIFTTIKYNIDTGTISKHKGTVSSNDSYSFLNFSSADASSCDLQCNYILNYSTYKYYSYANPEIYLYNVHLISETDGVLPVSLADIKSGKICYAMNEAVKNDAYGYAEDYAFYQNIGTDSYPTVDATHAAVYYFNGKYTNTECEHVKRERQENFIAPTCIDAGGYDLVTYCDNCKKELSRVFYTISPNGHRPGPVATETSPQICTVCGVILAPMKEHTHNWASEWSSDGNAHWYSCSKCSEKKSYAEHSYDNGCDPDCNVCRETRWISGHDFGEWVIKIEPGTSTDGYKERACSICGVAETEILPATGIPESDGDESCEDETTDEKTETMSLEDELKMLDEMVSCSSSVSFGSWIILLAMCAFAIKRKE